ncbi:twin-arginine translocase subunit TatC [Brevundimonas sp. 2R-24]|uniref:Sec-independent protein translocase protein TatC n=1 Tax=Peiella sedimenti TaxID=3061083 RepID=A0ABT8SI48_9CAUL|nr:twin-arginine translocase subunit TatC [Caulobacteraceae bacterium XZ-24]
MSFSADEQAEIEASRAPLMEHLVELRKRLIIVIVAFIAAFLVCFYFAEQLSLFLLHPFKVANDIFGSSEDHSGGPLALLTALFEATAAPPDPNADPLRVIFTAPLEAFFAKLKLAGFGAIVLSFPIIAFQLYRFVAPGLYRRERNAFLPFLLAAPVLFTLGAALVYYVMLPFVLWFSLSQQITGAGVEVELLPRIADYLNLVTALILAFGLCFQLPVVVTLLGLAGMVSSRALAKGRRYAIVGVFVVAAIVTPPDPISQMMLAVPIILLYEISIWCVRLIELRRPKEA